jgi:hypothetical protein
MVRSGEIDFPGSDRSIGFPNRGRYLLVGTGTTVPAGIEKYYKITNSRLIWHINVKGLPEL